MNEALAQPEMPFEGPVPDVDLLPRLVAWLGRSEWSGHVAVRSGETERRLYLMDGHVQTATSSDLEESLTAFLISAGLVDATSVEQASTHLGTEERGLHFARKLVELGLLSEEHLAQAELERVVALAERILSLRNGVYRCEVGSPPTEMVSHALNVPRLVATSVLGRWEETWAMNVLGGMGAILKLNIERLPDHEATGADEAYDLTLLRVDGRTPLAGVLERSPLPELAALRFLAACRLLGIVEPGDAPPAAPRQPDRSVAAPRPEPEEALSSEALSEPEPSAPAELAAEQPEDGDPTVPGFYRPPTPAPAPRSAEPLMKEEPSSSGLGRWLLIALLLGLLGVVGWFGWIGLAEMSGPEPTSPQSGEAAP